MPNFPDDQPQGELQPEQSGGISTRAVPIGTDVGQALEQGGEVAQRMHFDAIQEANTAATTAFHNAQVQWELTNFHDPKTGLLTQQTGLAAPHAVDQKLQAYDQFTSQSIAAMPNDQVRNAAQEYVTSHRQQLSDQAFRYEDQQVKNAHVNIMENGVTLQSQAMVAHASDPQAVQLNLDSMKALRQDQGRAMGWDQDTIDRFVAEDQSKASLGMLRQMVVSNQVPQASAWLANNHQYLQGDQLTQATELTNTAQKNLQAHAAVSESAVGPDGQLIPREDFLAQAFKIQDPEQQERVLAIGDRLYEQKAKADQEVQRKTFSDAYSTMKGSPQGFWDPQVQATLPSLPPEEQERLQSYDRRQIKGNDTSDPQVVGRLQGMIANPATRDQFTKLDLLQNINDLSSKDLTRYTDLQDRIRSGKADQDPEVAKIMSVGDVVKEGMQSLKIDPTKDPAGANTFRQALEQQVQIQETTTGKKMGPTDIRNTMQQMLIDRVRNGGSAVPTFQVQPKDIGNVSVNQEDYPSQDAQLLAKREAGQMFERAGKDSSLMSDDQVGRMTAVSRVYRAAKARGDEAAMRAASDQKRKILDEPQTPPTFGNPDDDPDDDMASTLGTGALQ